MSKILVAIMFWSKMFKCETKIKTNFHSVCLDTFENCLKKKAYAFTISVCK